MESILIYKKTMKSSRPEFYANASLRLNYFIYMYLDDASYLIHYTIKPLISCKIRYIYLAHVT